MMATSLSTVNLSNFSLFYNLAHFICHLFIDGHFRFGHILYDPKVFENQLLTEIDTVCPVQIPWQTNDITQPFSSARDINERTDHILQLIFFDPKYLAAEIDSSKDFITFYRIFVFSSTLIQSNERRLTSVMRNLSPNSLILEHIRMEDIVNVYWIPMENDEQIYTVDKYIDYGNQIIQQYQSTPPIVIRVYSTLRNDNDFSSDVPNFGHLNLANYFASALRVKYINLTTMPLYYASAPQTHILKHEESKFYKEISRQYERISDKKA